MTAVMTIRATLIAAAGAVSTSTSIWAQDVAPAGRQPIEEVIVTAQKRAERLQDVPVPVTAISADLLTESNLTRMQDYYARVPGLSLTSDSFGQPVLAIRGVTTGTGNPTVGIIVDDVPYGSISGIGRMAPDIDPFDLAQVEVLRGPQGTLYGASSIGGLLKFVTADPSTDSLSGRVQLGTSSVRKGDDLGFNIRGSVNIPVADTVGVRASGFSRRDPGYIDDPALGRKGVNEVDVNGGRVTALWQPSQELSFKLGAFMQRISADGSPVVHELPGLGDLQQSSLINTGGYEKKIQVYSASVHADLGAAELDYTGGYNINDVDDRFDYTPAFGPVTEAVFGVEGTPLVEKLNTERLTQEVRLTAPLTDSIEGLFGLFYSDERTRTAQDILATDPTDGALVGQWLHDHDSTNFTEYATFADLTFKLSERFDVQVGGRQSWMERDYTLYFEGPYVPTFLGQPSPLLYPRVDTREDAFTFLVTPRFKPSDDHMLYARIASGYRPGGPNYNITVFGVPPAYDADQTRNYDVGAKGKVLDGAISYDVSLFYIDWRDIQLLIVDSQSGAGYFTNASKARSKGAELSLEWRPATAVSVAASAAWTDAELVEAFPTGSTAFGAPGDPLPFTTRFSGNLALDVQLPQVAGVASSLGLSASYVGNRTADFTGSADRQDLPAYTQLDLHARAEFGGWATDLFVNNLTDKRGLLGGGIGGFPAYAFNYIQPRTLGLSVTRSF
ncbi:MAG TPA: TonB-dependent receptor [Steroidobacteraceae bacterium]|nr:TonB-dependent receptor [Steroidobacteraceae bacterium]